MKLKRYWKIILSLAVILGLIIVFVGKSTIRKPDNNVIEGNFIAEDNDESEDDSGSDAEDRDGNDDSFLKEGSEENNSNENKDNEASGESDSNKEAKETQNGQEDKTVKGDINKNNSTESKKEAVENINQGVKNPESQVESNKSQVSVSIDCYTVLNNMGNLKAGKESCLGSSGFIYSGNIEITEGQTVKDLILDISKKHNIKVSIKNGNYITGINNLYEKDCGNLSGWMYSVNGEYPNKSIADYKLKNGDVVKFRYTCNLGDDL